MQTEEGSDLTPCPLFYAVKSVDRWQIACQCGRVLKTTLEMGRCLSEGKIQDAEEKPGRFQVPPLVEKALMVGPCLVDFSPALKTRAS
ncbi:hypothetical protein STEG23_007889 [Scotinomys teguina]